MGWFSKSKNLPTVPPVSQEVKEELKVEKVSESQEQNSNPADLEELVAELSSGQGVEKLKKITPEQQKQIALKLIAKGFTHVIIEEIENFSGLDVEVAAKMIVNNYGAYIFANFDKFSGLKADKDLANKLIEHDAASSVSIFLNKFDDLDIDIAEKLIKRGLGYSIILHLDKFPGLIANKDLAIKLIENGAALGVSTYLNKFDVLDINIAEELIKLGLGNNIPGHLDKFPGLAADKDLALKLVNNEAALGLATNLEKFGDLDKEIAYKLIEQEQGYSVSCYLKKFKDLIPDKDLALKLIAGKGAAGVALYIREFQGLDEEVALKIIEAGDGNSLRGDLLEQYFPDLHFDDKLALLMIKNNAISLFQEQIANFNDLDEEIILALIEQKNWLIVVKNLKQFKVDDYNQFILKLLVDSDQEKIAFVLGLLKKVNNLTQQVAETLISLGQTFLVLKNLRAFVNLDKAFALKVLDAYDYEALADNLQSFDRLDKEIAVQLIKANKIEQISRNLNKFFNLDKDIALQLIEAGQANAVAENLNIFDQLDQRVAVALVQGGEGLAVMNNLDYFDNLDHDTVAQAMIDNGQGGFVKLNLELFDRLSPKMLEKLKINK